MAEYTILQTRRASDDIIDVGDYITYTLLEPELAITFVKELRKEISSLKMFPKRYPFVDDVVLASQGIRFMPYKNYYIFYEVIDTIETVIVIRVGSNRRNWKEILRNPDADL